LFNPLKNKTTTLPMRGLRRSGVKHELDASSDKEPASADKSGNVCRIYFQWVEQNVSTAEHVD